MGNPFSNGFSAKTCKKYFINNLFFARITNIKRTSSSGNRFFIKTKINDGV